MAGMCRASNRHRRWPVCGDVMHLDMLHKLECMECNVHFNITICRSGHKLIYAHTPHSSPKLISWFSFPSQITKPAACPWCHMSSYWLHSTHLRCGVPILVPTWSKMCPRFATSLMSRSHTHRDSLLPTNSTYNPTCMVFSTDALLTGFHP